MWMILTKANALCTVVGSRLPQWGCTRHIDTCMCFVYLTTQMSWVKEPTYTTHKPFYSYVMWPTAHAWPMTSLMMSQHHMATLCHKFYKWCKIILINKYVQSSTHSVHPFNWAWKNKAMPLFSLYFRQQCCQGVVMLQLSVPECIFLDVALCCHWYPSPVWHHCWHHQVGNCMFCIYMPTKASLA